jgi:hypothetical protein
METNSMLLAVRTLIQNGQNDAALLLLDTIDAETAPTLGKMADTYRQPAQQAGKLVRMVARTGERNTPNGSAERERSARAIRPTVGYHVADKRVKVDEQAAFGGSANHRAVWRDVVKHPGATMREIAGRTKLVPKAVESSLHFLRTHRADGGECKYTVKSGRKSYSQTGLVISAAL